MPAPYRASRDHVIWSHQPLLLCLHKPLFNCCISSRLSCIRAFAHAIPAALNTWPPIFSSNQFLLILQFSKGTLQGSYGTLGENRSYTCQFPACIHFQSMLGRHIPWKHRCVWSSWFPSPNDLSKCLSHSELPTSLYWLYLTTWMHK